MRNFIFLILLFHVSISNAYEPNTHSEISLVALTRTELVTNPNLLENLGLDSNIISNIFPNSFGDRRNIFQLVQDGAEFEDTEGTPLPNDTETYRMKHHFYDPQNNGRPLTLPVWGETGLSSDDWILLETANIQLVNQNFSYSDANTSLYRALTSLTPNERNTNWGLTFQTLGMVVHHIQDMSQPQHTRNDSHLPWERGEIRFYESYTEDKRVDPNRGLNYSGYPDINLNDFNTARSFWGSINEGDRKGIAWFSSSNFVSAGTNFIGGLDINSNLIFNNNPEYPLPSGAEANQVASSINIEGEVCDFQNNCVPTIIQGNVTFIETPVYDAYLNQNFINERASTFSIFDYDLIGQSLPPKFALNRFNYDAAHEFLIPRAVAYSAGLIDYFFRGRISAEITADGDGIEIMNTSNGGLVDAASPTTFQAGGAFEVFYVTNAEEHKPLLSLTNTALGTSLSVDGVHTITGLSAALQGITDFGDEGKIIVLFDGDIGSERGLAVARALPSMVVTHFTGSKNGIYITFDNTENERIFSNLYGSFYFPRANVTIDIYSPSVYYHTGYLNYIFVNGSDFDVSYGYPPRDPNFTWDFTVLFNLRPPPGTEANFIIHNNIDSSNTTRWLDLGIKVGDQVIYLN